MGENKIYGIIYEIVFPNNKKYIGQTQKTLNRRKAQHLRDAKTKDYAVYRAIRKYGEESLIWNIIDYCYSQEELDDREIYWIKYYKTFTGMENSQGYNETIGGQYNSSKILGDYTYEQLVEMGNDYRSDIDFEEFFTKYQFKLRRHAFAIWNGKVYSNITGIPLRDYSKNPANAKFTRKEIDYILNRFKEVGRSRRRCFFYSIFKS